MNLLQSVTEIRICLMILWMLNADTILPVEVLLLSEFFRLGCGCAVACAVAEDK